MKAAIRSLALPTIAIAIAFAFAASAFAQTTPSTPVPDTSQPGPLRVSTAEYKFAPSLDSEVLSTTRTELWARAFWPADLSNEPHPILFLLHGNHPTCGSGSKPRHDSECAYTRTGACPAGTVVVPNHEGYSYLGNNLASWGFIVVSINANLGINCGDGTDDDMGLNLARGRLVLRHLERWYGWATKGGAPTSLGVSADAFKGLVDFSNVGLMGHSRGGEGVRAAYNLYRDQGSPWPARIPGLQIKGIFEIGAVDGQTSRTLDADETAWVQLLPMCDGDVSDLSGRMPFERMIVKTTEARKAPKALYMVWGANHNFFNTEWQENDSFSCSGHEPIYGNGYESEKQQKVAIASMTAFFRGHVGKSAQATFANHFDPMFALPQSVTSITHVDRDFIRTYDEAFAARVDEFSDSTGVSSNGIPNQANGIEVSNEDLELPKRASVKWSAPGADKFLQLNWSKEGTGREINGFSTLDFRVARQSSHMGSTVPTDFSVQLVFADGNVSEKVLVSRHASILGPVHDYTVVYQTVRVPLNDFGGAPLQSVRGVRFIFDQSGAGEIYLANVRFMSGAPFGLDAMPTPPATPVKSPLSPPIRLGKLKVASPWAVASSAPRKEFTARLVRKPSLPSSPSHFTASMKPNVEITVHSPDRFPVEDQLPTLVLNGRRFKVSRYGNGRTDTLVFSIPRKEINKLPPNGTMFVQYGHGDKVWRMPDYEKAKLISQ